MTAQSGGLVLCGAPLGNSDDASKRLRSTLESASVIAAEDTRRLSRLASDLGISLSAKIVSYFEGNEEKRTPDLVAAMVEGAQVALVTDGGMPSVSDPGYRLVVAALEAGLPVTSVPGPSAVTTALALSGLPCDRFCFEGFLPRKPGERRSRLAELATEQRTMVFFEATHRIEATLDDMAAAFGESRKAALCREITKTYEEIRRGTLSSIKGAAKGEITLVIAGAEPVAPPAESELLAEMGASGLSRKDAAAAVALKYGLSKRDLYNLSLSIYGGLSQRS